MVTGVKGGVLRWGREATECATERMGYFDRKNEPRLPNLNRILYAVTVSERELHHILLASKPYIRERPLGTSTT